MGILKFKKKIIFVCFFAINHSNALFQGDIDLFVKKLDNLANTKIEGVNTMLEKNQENAKTLLLQAGLSIEKINELLSKSELVINQARSLNLVVNQELRKTILMTFLCITGTISTFFILNYMKKK